MDPKVIRTESSSIASRARECSLSSDAVGRLSNCNLRSTSGTKRDVTKSTAFGKESSAIKS